MDKHSIEIGQTLNWSGGRMRAELERSWLFDALLLFGARLFAWPAHGPWATCFQLLILRGAGPLSVDHRLRRRLGRGDRAARNG